MTKRQLYKLVFPNKKSSYDSKHYSRITKPALLKKYQKMRKDNQDG